MQNFKLLGLVLFMSGSLLVSCDNDDETALDVKVDAVTEKKMDGEVVKYAPSFYVFSNKGLKSVTVKAPGTNGKTYTLAAVQSSDIQFIYKAVSADFATEVPTVGDYTFTVTDKGNTQVTLTDKLTTVNFDIAQITENSFASGKLTLKWGAVTGIDGYVVKLYNQSNTLLFSSPALATTATTFSFGNADNGWLTTAKGEAGKTYTVSVDAFKYESSALPSTKGYNVEMISTANKTITWAN